MEESQRLFSPPNDNRTASPSLAPGSAGAHSRTYQACIPCRQRKVRCDLGPVDNPHDPPCVRCRREAKECFFSSTRRKKRAADSGAEDVAAEELEYRGGRKRIKDNEERESFSPAYHTQPLTPGGTVARQTPLRRPTIASGSATSQPYFKDDQSDEQAEGETAAILQNAEVHSGHDALNVLIEAATRQRGGSTSSGRPTGFDQYSPNNLPPVTSPIGVRKTIAQRLPGSGGPGSYNAIDPAIMHGTSASSASDLSTSLKAWARFKFVREGWFTAREGIAYIDYFYKHLSPLTPIALPDYSSLGSHPALLTDEPVLVVALLTVTSRYMKLDGPGSQSRPYSIHQKLWVYLEGMINRLVWGQEQFGGGLCGAGAPGCDVNPYSRRGLRTLGTIEGLMLLTEWHPRSMHFPPDENDAELMLPDRLTMPSGLDDANDDAAKGIGGQRIDTWLEPCWRSDRICWMLLSMAMSLGFEIGVFDEDTSRHTVADQGLSEARRQAYEQRRLYVKNLLLVYTTQTSGRLGLTSMLPQVYSEPGLSELFGKAKNRGNSKEVVIHYWLNIASILKRGNRELFPNRQYTREIIRTGRYRALLEGLNPDLARWRKDFDASREISPIMRHILTIEYEYCKVYLNCLGLQAIVERCTRNTQKESYAASTGSMGGLGFGTGGLSDKVIPPAVLEHWYGGDQSYVREVIKGCRGLLSAVVDGLYPDDSLRHAPVRTYFRIVSVSMILLKALSLGAYEDDVAVSLSLMDRTIEALRVCIVDDVHVASRFADLLETSISRIKSRFIRMARNNNNNQASRSQSVQQSSNDQGYQQINPMNQQPMNNIPMQQHQQQQQQQQQQWQFDNGNGMNNGGFANGRNTPSHPLFGISTETYDFNDTMNPMFSVMPPPTNPTSPIMTQGAVNGNHQNYMFGGNAYYDDNGYQPDWLAIPLDPILNSANGDVNHSDYGPAIDGSDMLELLLNQDSNGLQQGGMN